jgi:RNA polymerase sigma-70 factor (ECF subfamily)
MEREPGAAETQKPATEDDTSALTFLEQGDQIAMATLYDRYSRIVYSVALRVLQEPQAAEDVLHEVFMQLWRTPSSFTPARACLGGWLAIVARHRAIYTHRRKIPSISVEDVALASSFNLADETERDVFAERARLAIQQLPRDQRKALEMAFFDGLTHTEIAEIAGETPGTVKTRIRSSLLALRKVFQP